MSELQSPHQLIEQAFEQARRSGKPDWWSMAIPVPKNRLLQLTDRKFREADYGAKSFREFLRNIPDLVEVHETPIPGHVGLRSAATAELPPNEPKSTQPDIRPDLWEAVLDFSSGTRYIWDVAQGRARAARENEQALQLPTITTEEFDSWRKDFAEQYRPADEPTLKQLEHWRDLRLPTLALPPACRGLWNKYLKDHVKERLSKWFGDHQVGDVPNVPIPRRAIPDDELQRLRDFVIECVQHMSKSELEDLRLTPPSVLRAISK